MKRLWLFLACGCAALACEEPDDKTLQIAEPAAGTKYDRCVVRARTDFPASGEGGLAATEHINWRLSGGREFEAAGTSLNVPTHQSFGFGVLLQEGANSLELGRCDEFDLCEWKTVAVTVENPVGAPDCRAMNGGQRLFDYRAPGASLALADGRVLVSVGSGQGKKNGLLMLKPDTSVDTAFGDQGLAELPPVGVSLLAPHPGGGFLGVSSLWALRVSAAGVLDLSLGNAQGVPGLKDLPCPPGSGGCVAWALREDGQSGFFVAGQMAPAPGSTQRIPFVMRLDANLAVTAHRALDVGRTATEYDFKAATIDASGRALIATTSFVVLGSLQGLEAGPIDLSARMPSATALAISGTSAAVLRTVFAAGAGGLELELTLLDGAVARPAVRLPLTEPGGPEVGQVSARFDRDGSLLVLTARSRAAEAHGYFSAGPATELLLARFRDGALDTTWAQGGLSAVTFRDAWTPVSSESLYDLPRGLLLDAAGAPWLLGVSSSFGQITDPNRLRGPCVSVTKLRAP